MCGISKSQDVFGVATAAQIDIDKTKLVERDNPLSRRVSSFLLFVPWAILIPNNLVHQLGAQSNEMTLLIFIICRNSMKCVSKRNVLMMLKVCDIFTAVTADKPRTMKLTIVRQRDKLEIVFKVVIHGFDDSDVHGNLQHFFNV